MHVTFIDDLPGLGSSGWPLSLRIRGPSALVSSPHFIARFHLQSGEIEWLIERPPTPLPESTWNLPRRIFVPGNGLWTSEVDAVVAEIMRTEEGGLTVTSRDAKTGKQIWEHFIPIPEAADWAEPLPAWPGAQTEEIDAFLADDPSRLIVCLFRQTRRQA